MTARAGRTSAARLRVLDGEAKNLEPSFRLLTQVSTALSTSLDLDKTLTDVLARLNELLAFDAATLFLLEDNRKELVVKAALGVPVELREVKSFKVGEGVVGWVVEQGKTALISDSSKDARYMPTGARRSAKTLLAAPLRAQEQTLGALVLVRSAAEPFQREHQRLVEAIAGQAAVAIDHARLFETERLSRRRAEALLAAAQASGQAMSTPELLERSVKEVALRAMRATGVAILVPERESGALEALFHEGMIPDTVMNSLTGTSVGSLAATAVVDHSARALSVPVRWQGTNLAAMVVAFKETGRPTAAEVELLEEVAGQVALGMERLRLQERVLEQQNEIAVSSERNRIARDMHDGIVQYVYGLGLNLEHARDLLQSDPAAVDESLATAVRQVNHVLSEMRTFIYQLRPTSMQEKEIGAWIIDLCRQFEQATGVTVDAVVGRSTGHELSPDISIALLRIVQEALANIYQHSGAKTARLRLDFSELSVRLSVEDDGRGFDPKTRPAPGIAGGRGLANIEERAAGLGGRFSLSSHPGRGTRLEVDVPYLAGSTVGGGSPR